MSKVEKLRNFIMENWEELGEMTSSSGISIGYPNVPAGPASDEKEPEDVREIDIDDEEETTDADRTGYMGIQAGSSKR
jgi:hypothetical protein